MTDVPILFRSTDNSKWGPGKDAKLTIAEGDGNLWEIQKAVEGLLNDPPVPISISNFIVAGSQLSIQLTDGSSYGPFQLPFASFRYRKEGYVSGGTYNELDLLPVPNKGLFLVNYTHTPTGAFNPNATNGDGKPLYTLLFGEDVTIYDVGFSFPGKPGLGIDADRPMAQHVVARDSVCWLSSETSISVVKLLDAPTADLVVEIQKNGAAIGDMTVPAGETTGTVTLSDDVQFVRGDVLAFIKPDEDVTAKDLVATLALRRGVLADFIA